MVVMALCFSTGEACLVAVIVIGQAISTDVHASATANGLLYFAFAAGALLAPTLLEVLGSAKRGLTAGLATVSAYAAVHLLPLVQLHMACAIVTGLGGALLWTSEGAFFSQLARVHATFSPTGELSVSTSRLAAIFATILPSILTAGKLLATAILMAVESDENGARALYGMYASAGALSAFGMYFCVRDVEGALPGPPAEAVGRQVADVSRRLIRHVSAVVRQNGRHRMLLLAPSNVAFGLTASNVPYHGTILVTRILGAEHVGWLFALSGLVSALAAALHARSSTTRARARAVASGALAFACSGMLCAHLSGARVADGESSAPLLPAIVLLFLAYGYGNAVWQGTTMAVFADAFHDQPAVAFANLKLQSGLATAVAFLVVDDAGALLSGYACALVALSGGLCYLSFAAGDASREAGSRDSAAAASVADGDRAIARCPSPPVTMAMTYTYAAPIADVDIEMLTAASPSADAEDPLEHVPLTAPAGDEDEDDAGFAVTRTPATRDADDDDTVGLRASHDPPSAGDESVLAPASSAQPSASTESESQSRRLGWLARLVRRRLHLDMLL